MPNQKRTIKGTVPAQPPVNKTAQYLAGITPEHPGQQAFYREALTDIPHPLESGKTISYGGLQDLMAGPQSAAALETYRAANRLPTTPTPEAMQQTLFDQAKGRMLARGVASPGTLAFPEQAIAALNAPVTQQQMERGDYADTGTRAVTAESEAQRFANVRDAGVEGGYAAPGMAIPATRRIITRKL